MEDSASLFIAAHGSTGGKIFRIADDPNDIFTLLEISSIEKGKEFVQSDSLKEAMKESGVVGMPDIHILKEAAATAK